MGEKRKETRVRVLIKTVDMDRQNEDGQHENERKSAGGTAVVCDRVAVIAVARLFLGKKHTIVWAARRGIGYDPQIPR